MVAQIWFYLERKIRPATFSELDGYLELVGVISLIACVVGIIRLWPRRKDRYVFAILTLNGAALALPIILLIVDPSH